MVDPHDGPAAESFSSLATAHLCIRTHSLWRFIWSSTSATTDPGDLLGGVRVGSLHVLRVIDGVKLGA
jgi:hypothetical protein